MKKILIINSGSTSIKFKIFDEKMSLIEEGINENVRNHAKEVGKIINNIKDLSDISAIGHRFVHGGSKFNSSVLLTDKVLIELEKINYLAPLHNPYQLECAKACKSILPAIKQIASFDTMFFSNLPEIAQTYALPKNISKKYGIKRFGFHGLSHQFCLEEAAVNLRKKTKELNLITCHLGGGWSVAAIKKGVAIDTSMGFTPLEGLVMMTRTGDIDPSIIFTLLKLLPGEVNGMKAEKVYDILNKQSGLKGISGTDDFKKILDLLKGGDKNAELAFEIAIYKLKKYIGSYWAILDGKVDAIVFTGAIGAGRPETRERIKAELKFLGSKFLAIEPNEELIVAREAVKLINK